MGDRYTLCRLYCRILPSSIGCLVSLWRHEVRKDDSLRKNTTKFDKVSRLRTDTVNFGMVFISVDAKRYVCMYSFIGAIKRKWIEQ